jgi:hypothetical protein
MKQWLLGAACCADIRPRPIVIDATTPVTTHPQGESRNTALATASCMLALPAILGALGALLPGFLQPNGLLPMETAFDRGVIWVSSWGSIVAMVSPPATLVAMILAVWHASRVGWRDKRTVIVLGVVGVAVV